MGVVIRPAIAERVPSGLNAALTTGSMLKRGREELAVAASQIRAVWSSLAVTTRVPSG